MISGINFIGRTYRHINRYREIVTVLIKHGFGDLIASANLEKYVDLGKKIIPWEIAAPSKSLTRWERVRLVLEELGPTFIKLGQIMSNRPDLLPHSLILELEKLQDAVPPFPEEEAKQLVEEDLGESVSTLFKDFSASPLASASIAQVHKAVLQDSGEVVVKVRRPGIERIVDTDLEIMHHLATLMEKHIEGMDVVNPVGIVSEFERAIKKELDFVIEAGHVERFARNFSGERTIRVPRVFRDYTTKKILTMEYIKGIKISRIEKIREAGLDPVLIASRGADLVLRQIFEHGFFHADPHPGNLMVLEREQICFLDYGMMGSLSNNVREQLSNIIIGIVNKDERRITKSLLKMTVNYVERDVNRLELQVSELIEQHFYQSLKNINLGEILRQLMNVMVSNNLRLSPDLYLLIKALVITEGIARKLDPDFNLAEHTQPYATKLLKERLSPFRMARNIYRSANDLSELLLDLPSEMREILEMIKAGRIKMEFEHKGMEPMLKTHDQMSNRVVFAIIVAALIIGSSLIILSGVPPVWKGIPVIGIVGYVVSGIMGFWLLISIIRHGKM